MLTVLTILAVLIFAGAIAVVVFPTKAPQLSALVLFLVGLYVLLQQLTAKTS